MKRPTRSGTILACVGFSALAGLVTCPSAQAENSPIVEQLHETSDTRRIRAIINPQFISVSGGATKITAAGLSAGVLYGISDKFGIQADLGQAFSLSNASAVYTELSFRLTYAVTGNFVQRSTVLNYKGTDIYSAQNESEGGLRVQLAATEFLFNATAAAVLYNGLGGAAYYELPSHSALNYFGGVRLDSVSNSKSSLSALQFFAGVAIWF